MDRLRATLKEHRHFIIVVTLLTLVMTFPTIVYVFRTDVFWLPTGKSSDVYIKLWDVWYGKQFLTGQADRFHTDLIFYPEGVSLTYHPFFIPHIFVVNALRAMFPLSNAFSLAHLLVIWTSALSAYVYILWLFKDKWIALFGAVVFGLSPHVVGHANHSEVAFVATIPLALYGFHRGVVENRSLYIIVSGLATGLTTISSMYGYVCIVITLSLAMCAFSVSMWRSRTFWRLVALLIAVIALGSLWRLYPLMSDSQALGAALNYYVGRAESNDLIYFLINFRQPVFGPQLATVLQLSHIPPSDSATYLGYLPLALIFFGLLHKVSRRRMLPWLTICVLFLILSLGSILQVAGIEFPNIRLPKYYLNQIAPAVFRSFVETSIFMMGALLPLAVSSCVGIVALQDVRPSTRRSWFVVLLVVIVAFEYYIPVQENLIPREQFDYIDWLATEETENEVRLVNLPMGHKNSKRYNLYQALSGYPHVEGAISRTPDSAFDYIRANDILNTWRNDIPISCQVDTRDRYVSALEQLETDGFSHVVFHQNVGNRLTVIDSFQNAEPSYSDNYVWIYRLSDLRDSCPGHAGLD